MSDIVQHIRTAMAAGEIKAFYQPQYDSITSRLKSAEALARWVRADGIIVPPMAFIPELERTGNISELDWYICEEVCKLLHKQSTDGGKQVPISVNFSRFHVREDSFASKLVQLVDKYGLSHDLIEVEVTESAMVNESYRILDWIRSIREAGFSVAIDDFGSGLSSLSFAKDVPADIIKIDRSLLSGNCENEKERIVLECIFSYANRLGLTTVAEGVETREQLEFLRTCDCKRIQGYIFAKPMPADDYLELCRTHTKIEQTADILQVQAPASAVNLLMGVIFKKYPLIIFANLTRNSFYMMAYENFTSTSCPSTGVFDELIVHGASTMHPNDKELFAETFSRENLLKAYEKGKTEVSLTTRQIGDDGVYRTVETVDYFVKSESSNDVLVITLCENR